MGCAGSKTKAGRRREGSAEAPGGVATVEAVIARSFEPRGDRVNEWLTSTVRANTAERDEDMDPQSPGRASDATAEGKPALGASTTAAAAAATATDSAAGEPARTVLEAADTETKPQLGEDAPEETDGVSKSAGAVTQSSASSTPASPQPQVAEKDDTSAGSLIRLEMDGSETAKEAAADEVEVELSPPYSLPPAESEQRPGPDHAPATEPAPSPSLPAVEVVVCDAKATQLAAAESVQVSESKGELPRPPPPQDIQRLRRVRASVSSNTSASSRRPMTGEERLAASTASAPRRHSRKSSVADSFSVGVQPVREPAPRQHRGSVAAAAPPAPRGGRRGGHRDAAAALPSTSASSLISVTSVIQDALVPAGTLSEHVVARSRRDASGREAGSPQLDMKPSRYRESLDGTGAPHSQQPLHPAPTWWRRGFTSPIPYRQGYTNPAPDAGPLTCRPLATYLPPPTAYVIGAAGSAPPRLLLNPSAFAAIEASTAELLESHTLRLAGAHAGAAALTGHDRESEASASISRRSAAPWMTAPLAERLPTSKVGSSVYQEPLKMPPPQLYGPAYDPAAALPSPAADSSHSRSSQPPRRAAPATQVQQQQQRYPADLSSGQPSEYHTPSQSSVRVRAAATGKGKNGGFGADPAGVGGMHDAEQELDVYEQQYGNAQEPREDSVATYEPSTTDDVPTNAAVLLPAGRDGGSSPMLRYPWRGGSNTSEDEGA
ncbi:hypothetical protein LSCM1_07976 [Leishmania martiniquensis]|uniref:Uncharacterized protein n=1 Tax=Leishmania martiniquensis TaxID=1580590 RepID=A0A836HIA3_9TRYP|nr:hypothetical protein LSCM1_07976 [Leishmania martiniquensis]